MDFWITQSGLIELIKYIWVSLPLFLIIFYTTTWRYIKDHIKKNEKISNLTDFFHKEFRKENNIALSIFLWSKLISIATIIWYSMVFNIVWVILFSVLWYWIQVLTVKLFEKSLWIDNLYEEIIEEQNIPTAIMYATLIISVSGLIWSAMID